MNPLDRLQELLDEHGVKYERKSFWNRTSVEYVTWRGVGGLEFNAIHSVSDPDMLYIYKAIMSPEDVIAATIGCETCRNVGEHGEFACSECGVRVDVTDGFGYEIPTMLLDGAAVAVSYCPNCGRKVVK